MSDDSSGRESPDEDDLIERGLRAMFEAEASGGDDPETTLAADGAADAAPRIELHDPRPAQAPPAAGHEARSSRQIGRYEILGEIARGGVGVVLRGRDPEIGREVA